MADHEIELAIVRRVESSEGLDDGGRNLRVPASFSIVEALFGRRSGHPDAKEAFRCVEGKMIPRYLLLQTEEPLDTFHLRERISNQTVSVHEQDLLGWEKLRQHAHWLQLESKSSISYL